MRSRQIGVVGAVLLFLFCIYSLSNTSADRFRPQQAPVQGPANKPGASSSSSGGGNNSQKDGNPKLDPKPKPAPGGSHPIWHLVKDAERELEAVKARQSRTLREAVAEYRRRYGIPPPPHFDKWWAFAKSKDVQLVDEFDTVMDLLTPFWGLKPSTIRARAREAIGYDNQLMGMQIRGGNVTLFYGGADWMQNATREMLASFVEFLPDMDVAFNSNDESRVVVPHDDLARLVDRARTVTMPAANAAKSPRNGFTEKPEGLNYDGRFDEFKQTRFNTFPHQATWTHSRSSCPPDSPARILEEDDYRDAVDRYALGELGFVYNMTAMSDICLSPSLSTSYGFFERPNAYGVVQDLFPIFSQSKISSYSDIIYPSPWYWAGKVKYEEDKDLAWDKKLDQLYWRGSTTGGFSRNGGWRRQHRQRFVSKINARDQARVLANEGSETNPQWTVREVARADYKALIDVGFSHIGQCDEGDCAAQKEFFGVKEYAKQEDAFRYKHVLDIDGNAFSGRFYALLRSRSLVFKWAIFHEWHYEWLRPWAHFVPLSLRGDDWLEAVRFFNEGDLGRKEAERIAVQGRDWAGKVLRNEDMEVWMFRLLLEYARVIDDDRENIGFIG